MNVACVTEKKALELPFSEGLAVLTKVAQWIMGLFASLVSSTNAARARPDYDGGRR